MRTIPALCALGLALPHIAAAQSTSPTPSPAATAASPSPSPTATLSAEDAKLLQEIQAASAPTKAASPASDAGGGGSSSSALTMSNKFNPAMSVNGLFLGSYSSVEHPADPEATTTGIGIQEVELQFVTNVDPYFSANLMLSMDKGQGIGVEEGFIAPTWQPYGFAFRIGQLKVPFGRENYQHTHALPFVDKSLVGNAVFGPEGLNEFGVEASWLAPLPFYSLVYAAWLNGDNVDQFNGPRGSDFTGFGGLKELIDLNDDTTLELGGSYAGGVNTENKLSQVYGSHVILKWRPARHSTTRSAVLMFEGIYAHHPHDVVAIPTTPESTNLGGGYGYLQWQLAKRWFGAARFDYLGQPVETAGITRRGSALIAFAPTEFSALRAQVSETWPAHGAKETYEGFLQMNFTLGAHPAHAY
ncbi:MAG TPA: hypothetical protein VMV18_03250 [bacterium]|nr:hypothetical protein [bacterium]